MPSRALCVLRRCPDCEAPLEFLTVSVPSRALCVLRHDVDNGPPRSLSYVFQCPLELCVFCDKKSPRHSAYTLTFQCPLELCVFCDARAYRANLARGANEHSGFSALSSFVCSATIKEANQLTMDDIRVSVPSRALCVLRHWPIWVFWGSRLSGFSALSSFVCSATWVWKKPRKPRAMVSVPSRALCVLRPHLIEQLLCSHKGFSALSSFVCSATGLFAQTDTSIEDVSVPSRALCVLRPPNAT